MFNQKDPKKIKNVLKKLRGTQYDPAQELEEIQKEYNEDLLLTKTSERNSIWIILLKSKQRKISNFLAILGLFKHSYLRKPLLIAVVMQLSQQLSGITAVFYYSTGLFIDAGIPEEYT